LITIEITAAMAQRMIHRILQADFKLSKSLLRQLVRTEGIRRNGKSCYLTERVIEGDIIIIMLPSETSEVQPEEMVLEVLYEDEQIIVVNKESGVLVHPTARERSGSLLAGVAERIRAQGLVPHAVHRLDRNTTGVVLVAKHAHAHHLFDVALRDNKMHRVYVALVALSAELDSDSANHDDGWHIVELPIAQNPDKPSKRIISSVMGQRAVTHYRIVDRAKDVGLVQVVLETGRTHQIRLHMASLGMGLLGDPDYGQPALAPILPPNRQALHALKLGWQHPVTRESRHATARVPQDIRDTWRNVGGSDTIWTALEIDEEALRRSNFFC